MSNIDILKAEIDSDPLTRGYAGMTDAEVADSLNTADRGSFRTGIPAAEIFSALDLTEYGALSGSEREAFALIVALGSIDATDANTRTLLGTIFPDPSTTRTNLLALAQETVSRGVELGLGAVKIGHVEEARRL